VNLSVESVQMFRFLLDVYVVFAKTLCKSLFLVVSYFWISDDDICGSEDAIVSHAKLNPLLTQFGCTKI
jgi:hypothetical protein